MSGEHHDSATLAPAKEIPILIELVLRAGRGEAGGGEQVAQILFQKGSIQSELCLSLLSEYCLNIFG